MTGMKEVFPPIPVQLFVAHDAMTRQISNLKYHSDTITDYGLFAVQLVTDEYFAELERYCAKYVFPQHANVHSEQYDNRRAKR